MSKKQQSLLINILSVIGLLGTAYFLFWMYQQGYLQNQDKMEAWVKSMGTWGVWMFIFVQITQVVIPVIPGALTTVAGVIIFGPIWGSVYNFIGIQIGSVILFFVARRFGEPFVRMLIGEKHYGRYSRFMDRHQKHYNWFFAFMMAFPVSPADAIVMLTALTPISFTKFFWICFFTKPISIVCYSLGLKQILEMMNLIF